MLELEAKLTNHDIYTSIEEILISLEEIETDELSSEQVMKIGKVIEIITIYKQSIDNTDPQLVSSKSLSNMNTHVQNLKNEVNNFQNTLREQHLENALNHIENILPFLPQFKVTETTEDIETVKGAIISFRKSVGQHLTNVEKEASETLNALETNKTKLNELSEEIEKQKSRTDEIINDFQNQFSEDQNARNARLDNLIDEARSDFKKTIDEFQESADEQLNNQNEKLQEFNEEIEKQIEHYNNLFIDTYKKHQNNVEDKLNDLKNTQKEADDILGIMSMKGLAHGYQKNANSEFWKGLSWNALSILSLLGLFWFGFEFIIQHEGELGWSTLASRIILTGVGLTLFTYGAKQATNHRAEERRNRRLELELASLNPYIKDLEPSDKRNVRTKLVDKYFAGDSQQTTNEQDQLIDNIINDPRFLDALEEKLNNKTTD